MWARPHDFKSRDIGLKPFGMAPGVPGVEIWLKKIFAKGDGTLKKIAKNRKNRSFSGPFRPILTGFSLGCLQACPWVILRPLEPVLIEIRPSYGPKTVQVGASGVYYSSAT